MSAPFSPGVHKLRPRPHFPLSVIASGNAVWTDMHVWASGPLQQHLSNGDVFGDNAQAPEKPAHFSSLGSCAWAEPASAPDGLHEQALQGQSTHLAT